MSTTETTDRSADFADVRRLLAGSPRDRPSPDALLADPDPAWQTMVSSVVLEDLACLAAELWDRGWQPADLLRLAARAKPSPRDLVAAVLLDESRSYRDRPGADPDWLAQVDAGGAATWWRRDRPLLPQVADRGRLSLLAAVRLAREQLAGWRLRTVFPPLPMLRPPPSQWSAETRRRAEQVDPKLLARVQALLAKAEATEFADEGEALAAKAQELMTRHAIDASMLDPELAAGTAEARRLGIEDPYARQKVSLLSVVARANRAQTIYSPGLACCTVFGMPQDLALVELLYTSLLLQATRVMLAQGTTRDEHGRATTRSFRTSFLAAFAGRIGERLTRASEVATAEAERQYGSALLPVLARRNDAVDELVRQLVPRARTMRATSVSDGRGWRAGISAADAADLGGQRLRNAPRALES